MSLAPEIAIWEMVRRSAARNLEYLKNNVISELAVDLERVADLAEPFAVGLTRKDLTTSSVLRCQELAAAAINQGYEGVLVPSAAMPGLNLVNFPQNLLEWHPFQILRSIELPLETIIRDQGDDIGIETS